MIKIVDYKAGNAPSVLAAVKHLGYDAAFACTPEELEGAERIILPGVGSAGATMKSLKELNFIETLERLVIRDKILFLGICVGMQILFERSEEDSAECLNWLEGETVRFNSGEVRVPQMGWNNVRFVKETPVLSEKNYEDYFYFVNSYYVKPCRPEIIWGTAEYGGEFTAAIQRDNIYATQFHIEKSGNAGLYILENFLKQGKIQNL